jgi:hypothetical protein
MTSVAMARTAPVRHCGAALGLVFIHKVHSLGLDVAQAGNYSATMTYQKAVKAAGTTDADKVMAELKRTKINDVFAKGGHVRGDGLMIHSMYEVFQRIKYSRELSLPASYVFKRVQRTNFDIGIR